MEMALFVHHLSGDSPTDLLLRSLIMVMIKIKKNPFARQLSGKYLTDSLIESSIQSYGQFSDAFATLKGQIDSQFFNVYVFCVSAATCMIEYVNDFLRQPTIIRSYRGLKRRWSLDRHFSRLDFGFAIFRDDIPSIILSHEYPNSQVPTSLPEAEAKERVFQFVTCTYVVGGRVFFGPMTLSISATTPSLNEDELLQFSNHVNVVGGRAFFRPVTSVNKARIPSLSQKFSPPPQHTDGEAQNPGPLRIGAFIGNTSIDILVDTGSDFQCVDAEVAESICKDEGSCVHFVHKQAVASAEGFAGNGRLTSSGVILCLLSFYGKRTWKGPAVWVKKKVRFDVSKGLNERFILGMPYLTKHPPLWVYPTEVYLSGLYLRPLRDRIRGTEVYSLSPHVDGVKRSVFGIGQVYSLKGASADYPLSNKGWHCIPVLTNFCGTKEAPAYGYWVGNVDNNDEFEVLEGPLHLSSSFTSDESGDAITTIMARSLWHDQISLDNGCPVCCIREATQDDFAVYDGLRKVTSNARAYETSGVVTAVRNSYKTRQRTDMQAQHFPELLEEIAERRKGLEVKEDLAQDSTVYRDLLCKLIKEVSGSPKQVCPPQYEDTLIERLIKPFSDCFWHEGCAPPSIKGYKAHIEVKPGFTFKQRQPYSLSRFDEARLAFLIEEEESEGKIRRLSPNDPPPPCVTPVFVVDKKGSLIGRKVGAYQYLNEGTVDYYHPAPDADRVFGKATGREFHTLLDCVWGFSGLDVDEETSLVLAIITHVGVFATSKLTYGPKQGPAIYQSVQEDVLRDEYKPNGENLVEIFVDDTYVGDDTLEEHFASLIQLLRRARTAGIQYRMTKCNFLMPEITLLGFQVGRVRRPDPGKVKQLKNWPPYQSCADIVSHLFFASYLREFLGPEFV